MRKYIKSQLKNILITMENANQILLNMTEEGRMEHWQEILGQQQEAAIQVGEAIENSEGEGHIVVEELEDYCELLWLCSQETNIDKQREICDNLQDKCIWIEASIEEKIKTHYDILFLPYKASMWDSLESVWLAAKDTPQCNCYVMPIPYFDRNKDFSLGRMHYEGDMFPEYVPIIPYSDYDIIAKHPEAIFIHNPYDEYNYVTSVHPSFYSSELMKYTDMLVYIPYYICAGNVPEDYCAAAGALNADKVIVQSEQVRQTYLSVWKRTFGLTEEQARRIRLYDKIVALGSPKIDKISNTKIEDMLLPKEWTEKIYGTCTGEGNA